MYHDVTDYAESLKEKLMEMSRLHEYVSIKHMIQLIDEIRPKESELIKGKLNDVMQ